MPVDLERVIFIVGVGRSGTTLLQCMLNAHSRVAFMPETHFLRRYAAGKRLARRGLEALMPRLQADPDVARAGLDPRGCPECHTLEEWYRWLIGAYAAARGAARVGDKDPKNIERLALIRRWFPRARIIHVVRDPRDVVVSRLRARWSRGRPFLAHLATCRWQLKLGCRQGPELFGDAYREIPYETLVTRPRDTLKTLCRFLDLEYEPGMLEFTSSARELISTAEADWKSNCFRPVMAGNTGNWRGTLSTRRVRRIEWICSEAFDRFGYSREYPHPPPFRLRPAAWMWQALFRQADRFYLRRYGCRVRGRRHD